MQIWRMAPDGSNQEQVTNDSFNNWFPHVSPDGQSIMMISFPKEIDPADHPYYKRVYLRVMPVGGGTPRVVAYVYGGQGTINVPSWSPDGRMVAFVSNTPVLGEVRSASDGTVNIPVTESARTSSLASDHFERCLCESAAETPRRARPDLCSSARCRVRPGPRVRARMRRLGNGDDALLPQDPRQRHLRRRHIEPLAIACTVLCCASRPCRSASRP